MKAISTKEYFAKVYDQLVSDRRIMKHSAIVCMILAFLLGKAITSCAPIGVSTEGVSGPVAWHVTDIRLVQRSVDGAPRDLYAFTLVLKETQGKHMTFTRMKRVVGMVGADNPVSSESRGRWELKPHGELRFPFSLYIRSEHRAFERPLASTWDIILKGKDESNQPVRIAVYLALPSTPPPRVKEAKTKPPSEKKASLSQPTNVPITVVSNLIFVSATLAGKERATLLVDTGASKSVLSPDMARLLEISPTEDSPRKKFYLLGGRKATIPVVELSSIQVGEALVNNLQVGVSIVHPNAPLVDGILGGDFLGHFKVTVDRSASRVRLQPLSTVRNQVPEIEPEKAVSQPKPPKRAAEERSIQDQEKRLVHIPREVRDSQIRRVKLRSKPAPTWDSDIDEMIRKHNFFVKGGNEVGYFSNDFIDNGDGTITDRVTGLMWEKGGSSSSLSWDQAKQYVKRLNKKIFSGYNDWRIPTTEELASLLEPRVNDNGLHIAPLFGGKQRVCWSSDLKDNTTCVVDFSEGSISSVIAFSRAVTWHSSYSIRAVRTTQHVESKSGQIRGRRLQTADVGTEIWELELSGDTEGKLEMLLERAKIEKNSYSVSGKLSGLVVDYQGGPGELRCKLKGTIEKNKFLADFSGPFAGSELGSLFVTGTMRGTISESHGSGTWSIKHSMGSSVGEWAITKITPAQ